MFNDLVEKIKELDGIISCKITGSRKIDEIHVIADRKREPKKIVRDIETIVLVNLNQEIDHKKISIARVSNSLMQNFQQKVEIISIYNENNSPVCHYKLKINNSVIEEVIRGSNSEPLKVMIARGMVEVIVKHTGLNGKITVDNVLNVGINNEIILVQISIKNKGREKLIGSAYIDHNLPLAIGKACLKALNSKIK